MNLFVYWSGIDGEIYIVVLEWQLWTVVHKLLAFGS
jgi:hypothetical protein